MKKHLTAKNFIIVILIILLFLAFYNPGGHLPNRTITRVDSIGYAVHDTISVDSLIEVEIEIEVPVEVEVEKRVEVQVLTPVDTTEILKIYFAKIQHKDVLTLPNNVGTITIMDTISKNSIVNRKFISDIKQMIIKDTVYTKEPKKGQMYFGFNGGLSKSDVVSHLGTGIMYKTKEDKIYHLGIGVANRILDGTTGQFTPYVDGGVYFKIKTRR
jgi:hypothetical protein